MLVDWLDVDMKPWYNNCTEGTTFYARKVCAGAFLAALAHHIGLAFVLPLPYQSEELQGKHKLDHEIGTQRPTGSALCMD